MKDEVTKLKNEKKLVGVISLGCDKNRVDTEHMLTYLGQGGYGFTSDPSKAEIIIINTCGFIANARKESMDTIFEMSSIVVSVISFPVVRTACSSRPIMSPSLTSIPSTLVVLTA